MCNRNAQCAIEHVHEASRVFIYSGVTQSCYRSHDEKKENFVIKTIFEHEVFVYKYLHAANGAHKRDIAALGET